MSRGACLEFACLPSPNASHSVSEKRQSRAAIARIGTPHVTFVQLLATFEISACPEKLIKRAHVPKRYLPTLQLHWQPSTGTKALTFEQASTNMCLIIDVLDHPFELSMACFLWTCQHIRGLLWIAMVMIHIMGGCYVKKRLRDSSHKAKQLSTELARHKARHLQKDEIIQHLATENDKLRNERPIAAYMEESVHTLLALRCKEASNRSNKKVIGLTSISRKEDLLLPQDPEDRKCIICLGELAWNEKLVVLPCGHIFHTDCQRTWMEQSFTCAHCQRKLCWVMALLAPQGTEMSWKYARNAVTEIGSLEGT